MGSGVSYPAKVISRLGAQSVDPGEALKKSQPLPSSPLPSLLSLPSSPPSASLAFWGRSLGLCLPPSALTSLFLCLSPHQRYLLWEFDSLLLKAVTEGEGGKGREKNEREGICHPPPPRIYLGASEASLPS